MRRYQTWQIVLAGGVVLALLTFFVGLFVGCDAPAGFDPCDDRDRWWRFSAAFFVALVIPSTLIAFIAGRTRGRLKSRPCPRCGNRVPVGVMSCEACGFDFTTIGKS